MDTIAVAGSSDRQPSNTTGITSSLLDTLIDVRGRVVDEKGEPLEGVTVTVKSTSKGTSTNSRGEFSLSSINKGDVLEFTYVGYGTHSIQVNRVNNSTLIVSLKPSVNEL